VSPRSWQALVEDIVSAVERIENYTSGMDAPAFAEDTRTIDAVIRNFIVIGEASRHIPTEVQAQYSSVPWRLLSDMRNFAVHHYWAVDPDVLWKTLREDFPPLLQGLRKMLNH